MIFKIVGSCLLQPGFLLELGVDWQRNSKRGTDKAERERYRMKVYNTIPYFNDRPTYKDGWLVYSSTSVPTKNAISLTP